MLLLLLPRLSTFYCYCYIILYSMNSTYLIRPIHFYCYAITRLYHTLFYASEKWHCQRNLIQIIFGISMYPLGLLQSSKTVLDKIHVITHFVKPSISVRWWSPIPHTSRCWFLVGSCALAWLHGNLWTTPPMPPHPRKCPGLKRDHGS